MSEFVTGLFDTTGFVPRGESAGWTPALVWLHIGGDLFIWLACVSIPLVLLYFTRRRDLPYPGLFVVFALFLLACGFVHFLDALAFKYPVYRLAGAWKAATAVAAWAVVAALVPVVPRVMRAAAARPPAGGAEDTAPRSPDGDPSGRVRDYIIAVLAGVLALLIRAAIDPLVETDHFFVLTLLTVVFVSWQCGFGPGLVTLGLSMAGMVYFFIDPRQSFVVGRFGDQLSTAVFFFCGVCCAALGEAQQVSRRRAKRALEVALERKAELEAEGGRRQEVERALRQSEATLRAFYDSAPVCMGIVEPLADDVAHVYDNAAGCRFFGVANGETAGKRASALGTPPGVLELWLAKYRESGERGEPVRFEYQYDAPDGGRWLSATVSPVGTDARGRRLFCYLAEDATDRKRAELALEESEARFRTMADSVPAMIWVGSPDAGRTYFNRTWLEFTGRTAEQEAGFGWVENVYPDDRERYLAEYRAGVAARRPFEIEYRLRRRGGEARWVLARGVPRSDSSGAYAGHVGLCLDVTDRRRAAEELAERARAAALRADVAGAVAGGAGTRTALRQCAEALVRHTGAAFARVWTTDPAGEWLELRASAGQYTHTDGPHARVRVGEYKIGRIAASARPHLTNDVPNDPTVSDPAWAAREGMVAFAGFPLAVEGKVLGVMALFAREKLSGGMAAELAPVADTVAQYLDRRRAEEVVRESEEKFRAMADAIPQLAWMARADGHIVWYNRRWYEYTGTTPEQMDGWGWQTVHDPEALPAVLARWRASLASGDPFEMVFPLKGADGRFRPFLTRVAPTRDETGAVVRWFGTNTDISAQRELEEVVRASERRYRTLTEAIPQIVWNADAAGEVTYFNRRWLEYTRLPVEQAGGRGWTDAVHPDDRDRVYAEWRRTVGAAAAGSAAGPAERFTHELRLRGAAAGEYRWFLTVAVPLRGPDGAVDQWIGSMADIHDQKTVAETLERVVGERTSDLLDEIEERKRAEAEVRQQREFLDVILANVADGIVACDEAGTLTMFNRAALEFHGLPPEPLPPEQWAGRYDLFRADGATPLPTEEIPLFRALRGERVRDAEMVIAPRGAPSRALLASGQRLTDADGRHRGAVVSMRDVTDRKEAERQLADAAAELRRANTELERSNRELEQFAYVASHDLQEPLRKIQAFGNRLTTKYREALPEGGREYVDRMQSSAGRMRRLIDDLLSFSRVATQVRPFRRVDLGKLVSEVVGDLEERVAELGGEVRVGELPEIDGDASQLRQLFQNLIANALKFHRPGVPPVVELTAERVTVPPNGAGGPTAACRITVRDNGIGFDEKYLDRIFQVFQRLHGRDEYEGTGVGLAICRKIVERHGGTITAHSRPGEGASFEVTIPVRQPREDRADDDRPDEEAGHDPDGR